MATSEIDKDAILSYAAIHCGLTPKLVESYILEKRFPTKEQMVSELQSKNIGFDFKENKHTITERMNIDKLRRYYLATELQNCVGDISKLEKLPYADFWTYSFPCQDISVSGKQAGIKEGTRSGLLFEVERLLKVASKENTLPKYLLMENVKNLVSAKFMPDFTNWLISLENIGYETKWGIMNAKDYGVPQNRERVFAISIRKDQSAINFRFPEPIPLKLKLKDLLEDKVEEKYYISQTLTDKLISQIENKTLSNTVRSGGGGSLDRHQWDLVATKFGSHGINVEGNCTKFIEEREIVHCLQARDYKGFSHRPSNAVMEGKGKEHD